MADVIALAPTAKNKLNTGSGPFILKKNELAIILFFDYAFTVALIKCKKPELVLKLALKFNNKPSKMADSNAGNTTANSTSRE